jgi:SAM-dependent methyltransferase
MAEPIATARSERAAARARAERILVDPASGKPLAFRARDDTGAPEGGYVAAGRTYPIVRGVPRFCPDDAYARSFSFEWTIHARTQVDTHRADRMSEAAFATKTGFTAAELAGKLVLDAGVGAGRFAEVASRWGADVVGVDLSAAVESAAANLADRSNAWILQADIGALPFAPASFDAIFSIGVLHHTPDARAYFSRLAALLKPGGEIAIWVYPKSPHYLQRRHWVRYVNKLPPRMYYAWCRWYVPWVKRHRDSPLAQTLDRIFEVSAQPFGIENDILDTFDAYSPRYHSVHAPEEVESWFRDAGLVDLRRPGDETSVRGRKPAAP